MFPKGPVPIERALGSGASSKIAMRKMFDAERKELTDKFSPASIP